MTDSPAFVLRTGAGKQKSGVRHEGPQLVGDRQPRWHKPRFAAAGEHKIRCVYLNHDTRPKKLP